MSRIAVAMPSVPITTSGVNAFGTTRVIRIRIREAPSAREAATKSSSLMARTLARITRAYNWRVLIFFLARSLIEKQCNG